MGGGSQSVEQTTKPWGPYQDLHRRFAAEADNLYDRPQRFFPGQITEGQSRDTLLSYDLLREFTTGNSTGDAAGGFARDVLGGEFMPGAGGNPYLDQVFETQAKRVGEQYQRIVMPTVNSRFAAAGRSGSPAAGAARRDADRTLSRTLGELSTDVYYGDYERRMGDRMRALGLSPGVNQAELGNLGALRALGQDEETYQSRLIQEAIQRFQFAQQEPEERLNRFGSRIGVGSQFGTTKGTQPGGNAGLSVGLGVLSAIGSVAGAYFSGGSTLSALPGIIAGLGGATTAASGAPPR